MTRTVLRRTGLSILFLIAIFITLCNIDWVVNPLFTRSFGNINLGYRALIISTLSLFGSGYVYYFGRLVDKIIVGYEENGQTIEFLSSSHRKWDRIKASIIIRHKEILHPENRWIKRIKNYGYPAAFAIGIIPEVLVGARTTLVSFCAMSNWPRGFAIYLVADFLKNVGMSAVFGKLFH